MSNHSFELPAGYKKWTAGLIGIGIIALLYGLIAFHPFAKSQGSITDGTRFWAVLLQNSVFWLMITNACMFFICIHILGMGGWHTALRRVPEALSTAVPILGVIAFIVFLAIICGGHYDIYPWLDSQAYNKNSSHFDAILNGKHGFLNPTFFLGWSAFTIILWSLLGKKIRSLSLESDKTGTMDYKTGKKWIKSNFLYASIYIVFFGLTVGATIPWLWLMSIDAHWYSTMYSWYTFGSTFVSGIALIGLFVIYLKNRGQLEFVTEEHLQDIGKYIFAFSIFWTYLWFAQYLLIWYGNIPEETDYFKIRVYGPFRGIFFLNIIINFICPLLILMKKSTKRSWTLMTFMSVLIVFGHWIDFWQMVMPGTLQDHAELSFFEFGIAALFVGIIMWRAGIYFSKNSLLAKNNPFLKESMIHHT